MYDEVGLGAKVLATFNLSAEEVRSRLVRDGGARPPSVHQPGLSDEAKDALRAAGEFSGGGDIGSDHLLLGLVMSPDRVAAQVVMQQDDATDGWLLALRDPVIARAMNAIHQRPREPWTIESLAREVSVSRATLARRFAHLVGETPPEYLTRWRMGLAAQRLRDTDDTVAAIAAAVGYRSEYSFSRAFTRHRGLAPGRYRRHARAGGSLPRLTDAQRADSREPALPTGPGAEHGKDALCSWRGAGTS
jgi:AraC-like DNA-binding protein